jgi:hypothetical protein
MNTWENHLKMGLDISKVKKCELDLSVSGQGPVMGSCELRNEPSGSEKGGEFP